jgi:hypothetical protein
MKIKKLLSVGASLLLTLAVAISTGTVYPVSVGAEEASTVTAAPTAYISDGLVSWFDGVNNTRSGQNTEATVWEDLISGYDLPVAKTETNYFTEDGFHLNSAEYFFPDQLKNLVNGQAFTVEIRFGDTFTSLGADYNNFMNSSNDAFALFRRNATNVIEFKYASNAPASRPTVSDGLNKLQGALITITYEVGGQVHIYLNGQEAASADSPSAMGADDLFIGQIGTKAYEAVYRSMRFYDRALDANEVAYNAVVDGYASVKDLYVQEGLVSLYSNIQNTADGYDANASVWTDLVSGYNLPLSLNESNGFTREGLHLNSTRHFFPQEIVNLVNGNEFTVEMYLGDLLSLGSAYNTFINSDNDAFSLFRRTDSDVLEFKFAGNTAAERPTAENALELFSNSVVAITYKVGGYVTVYVDGVQVAQVACSAAMGANNLFLGHPDSTRNYDTTFRSLRFYSRELTAAEVLQNAKADCVYEDESQKAPQTYTITFTASNQIVAKVEFTAGATSVQEPTVPAKEGYTGAWASYTMADKNFVVKAVYTAIPVESTEDTEGPATEPPANETVTEPESNTEVPPATTDTEAPGTKAPTASTTQAEEPTQAPESGDTAAESTTTSNAGATTGGCSSVLGGGLALLMSAVAAAAVIHRKH